MKKTLNIFQDKIEFRFLFLTGVLFFLVNTSFAQDEKALFNYVRNPILTEKQQKFANAWIKQSWAKSFYFIRMNPRSFEKSSLNANLPDNFNIRIDQREKETHPGDLYSWKGIIQNPGGNGDFVVHGNMITARISSFYFTWLVYPISDGLHVLIEVDGSKMSQDESNEGYQQMIQQAIEDKKIELAGQQRIDPETGSISKAAYSGDCKVRILVAYTTTAAGNMADPISFIISCIDATNTAYDNSAVSFHAELAVAIEENYTESLNSATDKTRFHDVSDGYMDDVHDYRTYFDADMCVLITENLQGTTAGEAYVVANSSYTEPFCVVKRNQCVANLSFPHELGHLYGCRHDTYVDNTSTPYSYGHGYVSLANKWRTVMAYNNYCADNGSTCTRIQYFSNPNVNFGSVATGTAATNDNASALLTSKSNIANLENTIPNKIFYSAYTFSSGEYGDVIASNSVTNTSTFTYENGSKGSWRSGNTITLSPGFTAREGSTFHAYLDACTALKPAPTSTSANKTISQVPSEDKIQAYPNPFKNRFNIVYVQTNRGKLKMNLYNMMGEKVKELLPEKMNEAGPSRFIFDGSDLKPGVYLCVAYTEYGAKSVKITKQ